MTTPSTSVFRPSKDSLPPVGTSTNTTAGSVAFDGTAATNLYAGAVTVTGLNAAGYNPTGSPTTTVVQMVKAGGGAPSIPAEPAAPLGWRIRFDSATATVALRNIAKTIIKVSGGDTVTLNTALSTAPSASDVFYIEKAGVIVDATAVAAGPGQQASIGGIDFNGQFRASAGIFTFSFCACTSYTAEAPTVVQVSRFYQTGAGTNVAAGGGA
jgi:hypothetical protein